jgi:RNA polymerase sigma-70 factor (ECF subfamily)
MTCKGVLGSLSDYIEGDAGKKVCAEIEEHLDGCEKCRMHVDTMRAVVILYKGWRSESIPRDVSKRLKQALAEVTPKICSESTTPRKGKSIKVPKKRGKRKRKK